MKQKYCWIISIFLFLTVIPLRAQQLNIPSGGVLASDVQLNVPLGGVFATYNQKIADLRKSHSAVRPFLTSHLYSLPDSVGYTVINYKDIRHKNRSWAARKLLYEHFIVVDKKGFILLIDPMLNFSAGKFYLSGSKDSSNYTTMNTRGIYIQGNIGKKFSFSSKFYENQALFPPFINKYADSHADLALDTNGVYQPVGYYGLIPGEGLGKPFKKHGRDYGYAEGYISYHPNKNLLFQLGTGKNIIGYGYRSLLLSDVAYSYPYFKTQIDFFKHKLRYTVIYAQLQDLYRMSDLTTAEPLYYRKAASFHYLDWQAAKHFNIGLFEGGIYQTMDSTGSVPFNLNILEPLPFVNSLIYGLNANNNMKLGLNMQYVFPFKLALYYQYFADDNAFKHFGHQLGVKYYGLSNFFFQAEFNYVSRFTDKETYGLNNFTQYNEPLGFIAGNNCLETFFRARWNYKRYFVDVKANYIHRNNNSQNIVAQNQTIYPESGNTYNAKLKFGYLINKSYNLSVYGQFFYRNYNYLKANKGIDEYYLQNIDATTIWFQIGLQTDLENFYTDF